MSPLGSHWSGSGWMADERILCPARKALRGHLGQPPPSQMGKLRPKSSAGQLSGPEWAQMEKHKTATQARQAQDRLPGCSDRGACKGLSPRRAQGPRRLLPACAGHCSCPPAEREGRLKPSIPALLASSYFRCSEPPGASECSSVLLVYPLLGSPLLPLCDDK